MMNVKVLQAKQRSLKDTLYELHVAGTDIYAARERAKSNLALAKMEYAQAMYEAQEQEKTLKAAQVKALLDAGLVDCIRIEWGKVGRKLEG